MYRDSTAAIEERVKDRLSQLNLDEKTAQIDGIYSQLLIEDAKITSDKREEFP
ncbi:hypothetical protein ACFLYN_00755 [Chloroflexota bacterium]